MTEDYIICAICSEKFEGCQFDRCPKCDWTYTDIESMQEEDEIDSCNTISQKEAKEMVRKGFNIWGGPFYNYVEKE